MYTILVSKTNGAQTLELKHRPEKRHRVSLWAELGPGLFPLDLVKRVVLSRGLKIWQQGTNN